MSEENHETISGIVREMRNIGKFDEKSTDKIPRSLMGLDLRTYADRIEASAKRELSNPIKSYQINRIGNGAAMRERESLIREDVDDNYHPNGWRVYVIEDKVFGFFAGFTNNGSPADVPIVFAYRRHEIFPEQYGKQERR